LAFLPFTTGAASTIWQEKPGLSVHLSLPPLPASIEAAAVEAIVEAIVVEAIVVTSIQRIPNCRSEHSGPKSSQANPDQTAVESLVSCEETGIDI